MITNNTYYKNELYIPHAKPSITSDVTSVANELSSFIMKYERECLIMCLGLQLALDFIDKLDSSQVNGLKVGVDQKWNDLLNGKTYNNPNGDLVEWRGIRFKNFGCTTYDRSFLANYVYSKFEQNYDLTRTGEGYGKIQGKNVEERSAAPKVVRAIREMTNMIQGKEYDSKILERRIGFGIDYYEENEETSLYTFIRDMNNLVADTYDNFKPTYWNRQQNQFGI
jgi:hypothetical protein